MKRRIILLNDIFNLLGNDHFGEMKTSHDYGEDYFPKTDDPNYNYKVEEVQTETHTLKIETWISTDGTSKFTRTQSESKRKQKEDVKELESRLQIAIEKEEFELAAKLRDKIKSLKV
jgi:excinuclease UvrABC helicase subunit UvrB